MTKTTLRNEAVWVACCNSSGAPDLVRYEVQVTQSQYDLGEHYDMAEAAATGDNYEGPFICFDESETECIANAASLIPKEKLEKAIEADATPKPTAVITIDCGEIISIHGDGDFVVVEHIRDRIAPSVGLIEGLVDDDDDADFARAIEAYPRLL